MHRTRSGGGYKRVHTPGQYIPPQPARQGTGAQGKQLLPPTPASRGPSTTVVTTIPQQTTYENEYTPASTFKIPVPVTFITGVSLIVANNIRNGKLVRIWNMVYNGEVIDDLANTLGTVGGELFFVIVLSFIAEINSSTSGIVFALFIGLWMVWAINNSDTILSWTSNIREQTNPPANKIIQDANKKG